MVVSFDEIELGDDLPVEQPDLSLEAVTRFTEGAEMRFPRFLDHDAARAEGLPGALVPGLMSQGLLLALLHRWAPGCVVRTIDTVFRGPLVVGTTADVGGAVTDIDDDEGTVEVDLTIVDENGRTVVVGTAVVAPPV
ncbi:MAG: hypothetical protein AAGA93_18960 [Actinomycetota bacterium]